MTFGAAPLRPALGRLIVASALGVLPACGPATYNVRASRAYANEDADLGVARDRADELDRALALASRLLVATPYTPNDPWVRALVLDDDRTDALRDRFKDAKPYDGDYEVPLVKLYRVHLDEVLQKAAAAKHGDETVHPSLLAAAATLAPGARDLPALFPRLIAASRRLFEAKKREASIRADMLRRRTSKAPPALGEAQSQAQAAERDLADVKRALVAASAAIAASQPATGAPHLIARDALDAVSFALRMNIEALAVAPYVVKHAKRLGSAPGAEIAARAEAAEALASNEKEALEPLAEALTGPARTELGQAAGFAAHEGLLSQAFWINLDATHLHAKADGELFFFTPLASNVASGGVNDYTGRTRRLTYAIDPVFMVGARLLAGYDFLHVKDAASLNAGYTTDRLFSSGGSIENQNSLGALLGIKGFASDVFDLGVGLLGVRTSVKFAQFTSGEVTEIAVDPTTGKDLGEVRKAPLQVKYTQIDVGYNVASFAPELAETYAIEDFMVGFRYMNYRLPRVLYELEQKTPGDDSLYVLDRQAPPQSVSSRFYMGGFVARFGRGEWPRIAPYGDLGLYGGAGPVDYHFAKDPLAPDEASNRVAESATMLALDGIATLGLRLRLTPRISRFRVITELSYHAELIAQGIVSEIREQRRENETTYTVGKKLDVGGVDLFHGPRLMMVGVF